jgi:predicted nucleotidyltransferase
MDSAFPIPMPMDKIQDFCRRHHIKRMWLFGSVVDDRFRPDSDVDVLVDFEEGRAPGWAFATLHEELEPIWGRKVDLSTPDEFRPSRREQILAKAKIIYGQ